VQQCARSFQSKKKNHIDLFRTLRSGEAEKGGASIKNKGTKQIIRYIEKAIRSREKQNTTKAMNETDQETL